MTTKEYKKYDYLEPILLEVNRKYISLNAEDVQRNNIVLGEVLNAVLENMRTNTLFDRLCRKEFYGGSYYDNLKVSKPNEYDLDLLLDLPVLTRPLVSTTNMPGYVKIHLKGITNFEGKPDESDRYPNLRRKLLDENNYLSVRNVLSWMEEVLTKALNKFERYNGNVRKFKTSKGIYYISVKKQGPAYTLKVAGVFNKKHIQMDIDLVPCFVFTVQELPIHPYQQNRYYAVKNEFFVVPKKPKDVVEDHPRHWRLSFQEQESLLIKGKERLKPTMRLLKRLRDSRKHDSVASYYIKTIFLWEVMDISLKGDSEFWNRSLSYVFMTMLKKYQKYLEDGCISYFWNDSNNLLGHLNHDNVKNISNNIKAIIAKLETSRDSQLIMDYFAQSIPAPFKEQDFWSDVKIDNVPPETCSTFTTHGPIIEILEHQRYRHLEETLQKINADYVRLDNEEVRRNNIVLQEVTRKIINAMEKDKLFYSLFRKEYYGGSYYDGLKVSKPNSYDLDLLLALPVFASPVILTTDMPEYVRVQLENIRNFEIKRDESVNYPHLALKLLDEHNCLSTTKVLRWIESVLTRAINKFECLSGSYKHIKKLHGSQNTYYLAVVKQRSVFTLKVNVKFDGKVENIDINLVPCFTFKTRKLPDDFYQRNRHNFFTDDFIITPKRPKNIKQDHPRYWRLSFHEQESIMIRGKERLKPTLRLMKKLRDSRCHDSISSYYIKTVFLLEAMLNADDTFWNRPLSYVFMTMMKKYQQHLEEVDISYFWNRDNNLLCRLRYDTSQNISNNIKQVIRALQVNRDSEHITAYFARSWEKSTFWNKIGDLPPQRRVLA